MDDVYGPCVEQGPLRGGGHRHRPPGEATQMGRKHDTLVQAIVASGTLKSTQMNVRINQLKLLAALQGRGGTRMRQEGNIRQNRTSGHVDTLSLVLYTLQAVAATMFSMHRLGTSLEARDLKNTHSR
jgi:hypothetical protein